MTCVVAAYERHKNLKIVGAELGIPWQTVYVHLKKAGVSVVGDKLRYGSDRDKLAALAESKFQELVPSAENMNSIRWQSKFDFLAGGKKVDVKASKPHQSNRRYQSKCWSFSIKKQVLVCDFIVCFCFAEDRKLAHCLLVPSEFFAGLQTVSVSCSGVSKWLDYEVLPDSLAQFFSNIAQ